VGSTWKFELCFFTYFCTLTCDWKQRNYFRSDKTARPIICLFSQTWVLVEDLPWSSGNQKMSWSLFYIAFTRLSVKLFRCFQIAQLCVNVYQCIWCFDCSFVTFCAYDRLFNYRYISWVTKFCIFLAFLTSIWVFYVVACALRVFLFALLCVANKIFMLKIRPCLVRCPFVLNQNSGIAIIS